MNITFAFCKTICVEKSAIRAQTQTWLP